MKTIRFISTLVLLTWCLIGFPLLMASCISDNDNGHQQSRKSKVVLTFKYNVGDVVYLKPDSVRAVIEELNIHGNKLCGCHDGPTYGLYYFNKNGDKITEQAFKEELIY